MDLISRERAIKEMAFSGGINVDGILYVPLKDVNKHLQNLPSVQPERKKGRWKHVDPITEAISPKGWMPWYCSECGVGVGKHQTTFCPNCGADMRGEKDE